MKPLKKFSDVFSTWMDTYRENIADPKEKRSPRYILYTHKEDIVYACEDGLLKRILQESEITFEAPHTIVIKTQDAQTSFLVEMSQDLIIAYINNMFFTRIPESGITIKRIKSIHT